VLPPIRPHAADKTLAADGDHGCTVAKEDEAEMLSARLRPIEKLQTFQWFDVGSARTKSS
jgi:hypothetical protein